MNKKKRDLFLTIICGSCQKHVIHLTSTDDYVLTVAV